VNFPLYLLLPLASSVFYAISAMIFKKVFDSGVNPWLLNFLSNIATCILAVPLLFVDGTHARGMPLYQPICVGLIFMVGQMSSMLALKQGDVSVATPLLGMKVFLVAVFTVLVLNQGVSLGLWAAAAMVTISFILLRGPKGGQRGHFLSTVLYSLLCASSFALCDILIQKWAPACGSGRFLGYMFIEIGLASIIFLPFFGGMIFSYSKKTWKWTSYAMFFIALQAIIMGIALSYFGNAAAMNIVFSSRGIWSVFIVWRFGAIFNNKESDAGKNVMLARLAGSTLLFAAIALVIIKQ